ncbi:SpoIIE family protein phosphatase [Streptomyces longwoodensis]
MTDIAAVLINEQGMVMGWSHAARELLGLSAEEVCGAPVAQLFAEADAANGVLETSTCAGECTALLGHAHGYTVRVRCRVLPLEWTSHRLLLAIPADRAEESEQGAALLRALLAQDRIGVAVRDTDLSVVRTNHVSSDTLVLPQGSQLADVMEAPDAASAEEGLRGVLETGVPLVGHAQHVRSLAEPVREWSLSVTAVRTTDRRGRPSGVTVLLTDATEERLAARQSRLRHRAALGIGGSLDVRRTAQDITDVLVPDFASLVAVELAEAVLAGEEPPKNFGGGDLRLRRMAGRAVGPWPEGLSRPGDVLPPFPDEPRIRSLQAGRTVIVDRAALERRLSGKTHSGMVIPEGGHSHAAAPLFARGLVLGYISAWRIGQEQPFGQRDADLLTEVAAHAAVSIDNARRYTREHRAAVALQQRLLPAATTHTPAVDAVGRYLPAGGGAEIGGDWFDAIPLPSLRVAIVVGDVIGHGLHAAATMGRLRTAVQTLADLELTPDELLARLDELVSRLAVEESPEENDTVGATCLVALYDPVTEQCTVASAGHPPPIVTGPDGVAEIVPVQPGPPLGVGGLPFEATTIDLVADSWLALYTDGLLGRPTDDIDAAIKRLADRVTSLHRSGQTLETASWALTKEREGVPAADDTALLLARIRPLRPDAFAEWEFPADPAAVAGARAAAADKLAQWGLIDFQFTVELIVSELVTNAVRYAGGPIGLRLICDTILVCEVSDPSNTQPRLRRASLGDEGGRGLFLIAQLSTRWGSRYGQTGKTIWAELELPG